MTELHTEISIDAAAAEVWKILSDLENYPDWNPFIRSIEGELKVGAALKIYMKPGGAPGMKLRPNVVECVPNAKLSWLGSLLVKGLFDGRHEFLIEPVSEDQVRFIQRETFTGILVPVFWGLIKKNTQRGFEEMNSALKVRAEKL